MKKNKLLNESGMALVITMGVLLLVTLMAVAFFSSQHTEKMASTNYRYAVIAEEIADGYLNVAINMLVEDRDATTVSDEYKPYDSLYELWGPKYDPSPNPIDNRRFSFQAGTANPDDPDLDPVIEGASGLDVDARWIDVIDDEGRPIGRVAVLVMPENSKINVNTAGAINYDRPGGLPGDPKFDGYSPYEISLATFLANLPSGDYNESHGENIVGWRYSGNPGSSPAATGPGEDLVDNYPAIYADNIYLDRDKVNNDGEWGAGDIYVDEANEGIDDPYEYYFEFDDPDNMETLGSPGSNSDDFRYTDAKMVLISWTGNAQINKQDYANNNLDSYLTSFSYENDLIDFTGKERVRLNEYAFPYQVVGPDAGAADKKALAEEIRNEFTAQGMAVPLASQLAVNIVDYSDYDFNDDNTRADVRTQLGSGDLEKPYLGIEKTVYIHEVNGASYNDPANAFLDQDPDDDYIELINISDRDIDLSGWEIKVGGNSPVEITSGTIKKWSGWSSTDHFMILAVEPGPDPIEIIDEIIQIPVASGYGFWIKNGHSFMDDVKTVPNDQIIDMKELRISLVGNDRITLLDNNGNIVDVSDSSDGVDGQNNVISWQRKDPTMDSGAVGANHTAGDFNDSDGHPDDEDDEDKKAIWLEQRPNDSIWEVKHVKDRYFSSVAEIAKVSGASGNWAAVANRTSKTSDASFEAVLSVIDRFTIAQEFDDTDDTDDTEMVDPASINDWYTPVVGNTPEKFGIGPRMIQFFNDDEKDKNNQAMFYGKININTVLDTNHRLIYHGLRNMFGVYANALANYPDEINGFGDGPYKGIGDIKDESLFNMPIEDFIAVSNLLTTKSNVFKITILAQAYDRKFNVAAERKLEVIVDRGYLIDRTDPDTGDAYSEKAEEKAKEVRVLSYRWVTEEE